VIDGHTLYERVYCARGEMENRIKEQQLDLFADRTSAATTRANQLRLWFASFAYALLEALRRIGRRHTQFQEATCGTIRLKLLKLGARVTVSVRRIKVAIASACPYRSEFALAHCGARPGPVRRPPALPPEHPRPARSAAPASPRCARPRPQPAKSHAGRAKQAHSGPVRRSSGARTPSPIAVWSQTTHKKPLARYR
jgi:hypothetical protein